MARSSKAAETAKAWLRSPSPLPDSFGLLGPLVAHTFAELHVGVSFWHPPDDWHVVHQEKNVIAFETEHGQESLRWPYNRGCFAEVRRTQAIVCGEHGGFKDLFVPVFDASGLCGIFVAGPFVQRRPTSADVIERWYGLTKSQGKLSDAGFAHYLAATLSTLTLDDTLFAAFERLLLCLATLAGGSGSPRKLADEASTLTAKLLEARSAERIWDAVQSMVSERMARSWSAPDQQEGLWKAGLRKTAGPVLVGLLVGRANEDAIDRYLGRDAFQRECTAQARKSAGVACGRVGDHGVVIVTDDSGSGPRVLAKLTALATQAQTLARRFGFKLHFGISQTKDADQVPARYRVALAAAERALSQGVSVIHGEHLPEHSARHLRKLRQQLTEGLGEGRTLSARFEHYTQTVLEHCGYRLELVRAKLEAGLERLSEPLLVNGSLDERSFDELWSGLERSMAEELTVTALVARYRQLILDIEDSIQTPTLARQERSMRRALHYMREHLGEPLTQARVARAAGFAPDHFGRLFKQSEKTTYERYLLGLRVERARQMLFGTSLSIEGVSHLCGFRNRIHFHRVFKETVGVTPLEYREREITQAAVAAATAT